MISILAGVVDLLPLNDFQLLLRVAFSTFWFHARQTRWRWRAWG